MRVSARVGVSAQGCGKKGGSKWFNSNTAQDSVRRLRPLRQGWAICPAFYAVKHAVLQGLVSRAPLLYFGPASVGARKQLADMLRSIIVKTGFKIFKSLSLFSSKMEDNTHTSKQAYVRQPHPS